MPMIELTTTKGVLGDAAKQRLAAELSTIALELEAAPMARFGDVAHMQAWAGLGEIFTLSDAAAYGMNTDEPGSKVDRMRQAAIESVGGLRRGVMSSQ
jgi:hypothetical protein